MQLSDLTVTPPSATPTSYRTTFQGYLQAVQQARMPFLGELVWFTIPESTNVEYDEFVAKLKDFGLEKYTPRKPKDADVFRRVCSDAQRKKVPVSEGVYINVLVRDVQQKLGHIWKQIVLEEVDSEGKRLSYNPVLELEYHDALIQAHWTNGSRSQLAWETYVAIHDEFTDRRGKLHAFTIRELFRKVTTRGYATSVRESGGVYFIRDRFHYVVEALQELTGLVEGATCVAVPLVNTVEQNEMVRIAFEDESVGEITRLIAEIKADIANGVTERRYNTLIQKRNELKKKAQEYAELLDNKLDTTQTWLDSLETNLIMLYKHID